MLAFGQSRFQLVSRLWIINECREPRPWELVYQLSGALGLGKSEINELTMRELFEMHMGKIHHFEYLAQMIMGAFSTDDKPDKVKPKRNCTTDRLFNAFGM